MYAGTSAGAAAASDSMIFQGQSENAILKGEVKISSGFSLVNDIVFDTHFINRGRIGRLFQVVVSNPKLLGVGLEENTGLLFTPNNKMEAIGPGMTIILDGRNIKNSNLLEIKEGVPISIDNLTLHVMSKTDVYDLQTRQLSIITPEECKA
jgi:cyanophycinase